MNTLKQQPLTAEEEQELKELEQQFEKGEIKGRDHPHLPHP
jgi:hypothetical protein